MLPPLLIAFSLIALRLALSAYGPPGHEIVGGIAGELIAHTPAGQKIYALTDGITLERASNIADEIKAWDKGQAGIEDEGGNTVFLHLFGTTPPGFNHRGLKVHGFWDNEAVLMNLPESSAVLSKEESYQETRRAIHKLVGRLEKEEPQSWRQPDGVALKDYSYSWADEILPVAREAHERLQFMRMHEIFDQGRPVMAGIAREKPAPDRMPYSDWSAKIVLDEIHKAGWRLADLLTQAVGQSIPSP